VYQKDRTKLDDVRRRLGGQEQREMPGKAVRVTNRLKTEDLERFAKGDTAKKVNLAEQYKLANRGDVARQLALQKRPSAHAKVDAAANIERFHRGIDRNLGYKHHPNFHHGAVSPAYARHCLKFNYWGPAFFAGLTWYPTWQPWVNWSWYYDLDPYWDPRPIWCRPVICHRCPLWIYWDVPDWTDLPVVDCGTWVDVEPVVVPAASDLRLLAVRFVDPGHPEQNLGPRYRVWFRNNGNRPVSEAFNVILFAANGDRLDDDLPQAGVRVTAIDAGDTQSVDIRLPVEVYTMGRDDRGEPAPFSKLHVLVDAHRELREADTANNGAMLRPMDILPVDPAAFELEPSAARAGDEVVLAGEGLGPEPGQVLLNIDGKELEGEILGWYDLGVRWTMPKTAVTAPTDADVIVIRGDGAATNPLRIRIDP
jgi:hypothetical protein